MNINRSRIRASVERIAPLLIPTLLGCTAVIGRGIYHRGIYLDELFFPLAYLVLTIGCGVIGLRKARMAWGNNIRWKTRLIVALCWLGWFGLNAIVFYPLMTMPMGGRHVPRTEPSEAMRIFHPSGFSIIPPPGWKILIHTNSQTAGLLGSGIGMNPGDRSRYSPGLGVDFWFRPDDLTEYQETMFRGKPAFEKRWVGSGEYARLYYQLLILDGTNWFRVNYSESDSFESPPHSNFPPIIRHYIESFRLPGETNVMPGSAGKF